MDPVKTKEVLLHWVEDYMSSYPWKIEDWERYREEYPQDEKTLLDVFFEATEVLLDIEKTRLK